MGEISIVMHASFSSQFFDSFLRTTKVNKILFLVIFAYLNFYAQMLLDSKLKLLHKIQTQTFKAP